MRPLKVRVSQFVPRSLRRLEPPIQRRFAHDHSHGKPEQSTGPTDEPLGVSVDRRANIAIRRRVLIDCVAQLLPNSLSDTCYIPYLSALSTQR